MLDRAGRGNVMYVWFVGEVMKKTKTTKKTQPTNKQTKTTKTHQILTKHHSEFTRCSGVLRILFFSPPPRGFEWGEEGAKTTFHSHCPAGFKGGLQEEPFHACADPCGSPHCNLAGS